VTNEPDIETVMSTNISIKNKTGSPVKLPVTDGLLKRKSRKIILEIPEALGMRSSERSGFIPGFGCLLSIMNFGNQSGTIGYQLKANCHALSW